MKEQTGREAEKTVEWNHRYVDRPTEGQTQGDNEQGQGWADERADSTRSIRLCILINRRYMYGKLYMYIRYHILYTII